MNDCYEFENIPLPYAYNALEPYIDAKTMELHHDKHLQTYIDNLNSALKDYPRLQSFSLVQLIRSSGRLPQAVRTTIKNNAGGVYNHRFYFSGMSPVHTEPSGIIADDILKTYGTVDEFKSDFKKAALSVFGSGYAWLAADGCGRLVIMTTPNQETPLTANLCPILNIDVWEHAYYLKYNNRRAEYIDSWFNLIDWDKANERYMTCRPYK